MSQNLQIEFQNRGRAMGIDVASLFVDSYEDGYLYIVSVWNVNEIFAVGRTLGQAMYDFIAQGHKGD